MVGFLVLGGRGSSKEFGFKTRGFGNMEFRILGLESEVRDYG